MTKLLSRVGVTFYIVGFVVGCCCYVISVKMFAVYPYDGSSNADRQYTIEEANKSTDEDVVQSDEGYDKGMAIDIV